MGICPGGHQAPLDLASPHFRIDLTWHGLHQRLVHAEFPKEDYYFIEPQKVRIKRMGTDSSPPLKMCLYVGYVKGLYNVLRIPTAEGYSEQIGSLPFFAVGHA
jgi:hypothetical protein